MQRFEGVRRLVHITRNHAGIERAVDDELRFHFDMTMRELMANGMTPDEARKETERRFGDVAAHREQLAALDREHATHRRRADWWSGVVQDFGYAMRGLRRNPAFAIAVILTLGLGIGANATMFGVVDRLLFRPPEFLAAPERTALVYFGRTVDGKEDLRAFAGYKRYTDLQSSTRSFDAMTPFYTNTFAIGSGEATRELRVGVGGADLWRMFDVKPVIGRFFTTAEDTPPAGQDVVVLSYAFWQTQFGGRTDALGSRLDFGTRPFTVIGVAPEGFNGFATEPVVAFMPIAAASSRMNFGPKPWYQNYNLNWFNLYVRRSVGVSPAAADADLTAAFRRSYLAQIEVAPRTTPIDVAKPRAIGGPVLADRGPKASSESKVAAWLAGVAGVVLLIACANVANLLLARALRRRREIAVRVALGVSRARLLMQLSMESTVLAVLGGVAGLILAQWGGAILRSALLGQANTPNVLTDSRVLLFSAALVLLTGLLTGVAPVLYASRSDVAAALKAGARGSTVHRSRLRVTLLVVQAALSVVLLVGAGLFVRSLSNVEHLHLGYDADRLVWLEFRWRGMKLDSAARSNYRQAVIARAGELPEVEHAARALAVPFLSEWNYDLFVPGIDSVGKLGTFPAQAAGAGFFETMGTRILRGRGITAEDRRGAPRSIVVSQAMATRLWPQQDAIGKCVRVGSDTTPCFTVVGVAEDVLRGQLTKPDLHYYLAFDQFADADDGGVFVRVRGDAADYAERVRRALQPLMPGVSYITATPISTIIGRQTRSWRLGATMFTAFGALALVLAAIGLYSVIAYNVAQRSHEMGVRVALGAKRGDVIGLVVRESVGIVLPGVVLGTVVALTAGRWIAPLLFRISPHDPPVLATVVVTLMAVAIVASWVPARRAARADPTRALRAD